jgi:hypothetical protein
VQLDYVEVEGVEVEQDLKPTEALQSAVAAELRDAIDYIDNEVSDDRAKATKFYRGEPFGTEEDGRSKHVSTDVRDTVLGMMPPLMRIFAGSERIAEFVPVGPEDVPHAEQATDAIHHIFAKENAGFAILYAAFKDALVRKTGIVKWWFEEKQTTSTYRYTGLDDGAMAMLLEDPEIELVSLESETAPGAMPQVDPMSGMEIPPPMVHEITIKRTKKANKYCVAAVPPEEFLFDRRARCLDTASVVAHRQYLTVSDLVAMGYDEDDVRAHMGAGDDELETNEERYQRNPQLTIFKADRNDEASKKVLYVEAYIKFDLDKDGIAELLKVCTIGSGYKVANVEPTDEIPFSYFTPDPEPHTLIGLSEADKVMDIQETKSEVVRGILDSLAQSIHPRTGIVEGQVNLDDVLNNETGAVIRMRAPGMVQPFTMPFVGQQAFPLVAYLDEVKEARTGVSKASQGLNADALQSSTRAAVAATISAAQGRVELVARVFAETGLKRLFRGLLKMFIKHQDQPRMMRLRGQFVPIDPRVWNADMDVEINVALSASSNEERIAVLQAVAEKQEMILQQLGPNNPLVTLAQYRNTLAKAVELSGFKDPARFFNDIPADFQMPQPEPQKTPEQMLAEVQAQAIQADIGKKAAELELEREKMMRSDDRERDRIEADAMLRAKEIEVKYGTQVNVAHIHEMMERDREAMRMAAPPMPPQPMPEQMPQQPMPEQMPPGDPGMPIQ